MMDTTKVDDMRRPTLGNALPKFTMVGSYPLFYLDDLDNILCSGCVNDSEIEGTLEVAHVNWEDSDLQCEECGERIECAYEPA